MFFSSFSNHFWKELEIGLSLPDRMWDRDPSFPLACGL